MTAHTSGYLTARLHGGRGDWDLAVFARGSREPVAASAYEGSVEVAGGFVTKGQRLTLQACRRGGHDRHVRMSAAVRRVPHLGGHLRLVRVRGNPGRVSRLGLDVTEHVGPRFADVLLHGRRDRARLRRAGLSFHSVRPREKVRAAQAPPAMPSGRNSSYRRLADYSSEMKALAADNPGLVKLITLPHKSVDGRPIEGLEITSDVSARDGKPVMLMLGLHHAREWPSGEFTLEWAYELVNDFKAGDPQTTSLLGQARVIVVPVTNPDGFNYSREAGHAAGHDAGDNGFNGTAEYQRKNCRGGCGVSGNVDINRNYGDRWGGEGGTDAPSGETYRGTAPFSEPEAQDIRELISSRQVVTMITNHTFADDILRQPGAEDDFPTPDEPLYKQVSEDMGAAVGYSSIASYELYAPNDHVGTTDGWSYFTTGGLGYVIEALPDYFHPSYSEVVQHYRTGSGNGGSAEGMRGAFFVALESTANAARHSVITGAAPAGAVLRLTKSFQNRTSLGPPTDEHFESTMVVPDSGQFAWHVNQSGRPLAPTEEWTLTCEQPEGSPLSTQQVSVIRGQSLDVGALPCKPVVDPPPTKVKPIFKAALAAFLRKHWYRVHVSGTLSGFDPGRGAQNCAGKVVVELFAAGKLVRRRTTAVDAGCGFDRAFRFRRSALPKRTRKHGVKRMRAVAHWQGNDFLEAADQTARVRVKHR